MSDPTKSTQAPLDVAITTQGATQAVNTLVAALQNMGGVLANINHALDEHQQKLINVSQNGKKLASTVGSARQIADTMNRGRRLMEQGSAGITFADQRGQAAEARQVAKTLRDQAFNRFADLVAGDLRKNLPKAAAMIRSGEISAADARAAATSKMLLNEENGNLKLAQRAGKLLNTVNQTEEKIAKEKADQLQAAKDKATADKKAARLAEQAAKDAEKEAKRQKAENERRQTAQWKLANMQEQANLSLLSTPYGQSLAQANANRSAIKRGQSGVRQQEIDQFIADNAGRLQGQNRRSYFDSNTNYMQQGGFSSLVDQQKNLGLHRQALEQMRLTGVNVEKDLKALQIQAVQIGNAMRGVANAAATATGTALGIQQFNASLKLKALDLTGANKTANTSVEGLNKQQALLRQPELRSALADSQKALNLARLSGDKKAEEAAKALNDKLIIQRDRLREITGEIKKRQDAEKKSAENFQKLNDYKYRTTSLEGQITAAKTKGELDRIARLELNKQLATAKKLEESAKALGNIEAQNRAKKLVDQYTAEQELIRQRRKELTGKQSLGDSMNQRFQPENQAASFMNRMAFMKDYLLMGGIQGTISGAYSFIKDFEAALKQTQAIAQGTEQQMGSLRKSIIDVSDSSRFSAIELTEATTVLAQAGFSVSEIEKSLASVATLATATGSTLKDSVDIATSVMGAFKMSAESMPQVVNQITQAMNLSKLDVPKFMLATQYAGNAASDLGVTFREMLSATAAVSNTGIRSGSTMGTGMRQLMADLTAPTDKMKKKMTDLGLTFSDLDIRMNGLTGVMKNLKEAGFSTADAFDSFELRAAAYYVSLSNNLGAYDEMYAAMDSTTAAARAQEIQMNSLAAQSDRMTNQFRIAADVLGKDLRTTLTGVAKAIANTTEAFNEMADSGIASTTLNWAIMTVALAGGLLLFRNIGKVLIGTVQLLGSMRAASLGATAGVTLLSRALTLLQTRFLPLLIVSGVIAGIAIAYNKLTDEVSASQRAFDKANETYQAAEERVNAYGTSVVEIEEKLKSLSSRSESLSKNQSELAVEFDIVRQKALDLGVDLETKVTNTVESLKAAWEQLRLELNKKILVDVQVKQGGLLDMQAAETEIYKKTASLASDKPQQQAILNTLLRGGQGFTTANAQINQSGTSLADYALTLERNSVGKNGERVVDGQTFKTNLERMTSLMDPTGKTQEELMAGAEEVERLQLSINSQVRTMKDYFERMAARFKDNEVVNRLMGQNITFLVDEFLTPSKEYSVGKLTADYQNLTRHSDTIKRQNREVAAARSATKPSSAFQVGSNSFDPLYARQSGYKITEGNKKAFEQAKAKYQTYVEKASRTYGIPESVIWSILMTESTGKPNQTSPDGARGLMQVMPAAGEQQGLKTDADFFDPEKNIMAGTGYLNWLMTKEFDTGKKDDKNRPIMRKLTTLEAIQAYNQGGTRMAKGRPQSHAVPYLDRVTAYNKLAGGEGSGTSRSLVQSVTASPAIQAMNADILKLQDQIKYQQNLLATLPLDSPEYTAAAADAAELAKRYNVVQGYKADQLKAQQQQAITDRDKKVAEMDLQLSYLNREVFSAEIASRSAKALDKPAEEQIAAVERLYAKKAEILKLESEMQKLANSEQAAGELDFTQMAEKSRKAEAERDNALLKNTQEKEFQIAEIRKKAAEDAKKLKLEAFDLSLKLLKDESEAFEAAYQARTKAFERYQSKLAGKLTLPIEQMKAQREEMDLPSNKGLYTAQERRMLDERIARDEGNLAPQLELDQIITSLENNANELDLQRAKLEKTKADLAAKRLEIQTQIIGLTDEEKQAQGAKLDQLEKELKTYETRISELGDQAEDLNRRLEVKSKGSPDKVSFANQLRDKYSKQWADKNTREGIYADIEVGVDSISSGFSGLTDNLMSATAGVEDFFRAFIGRSKEGKEAWREFGLGILRTMMKIMTDRIVAQFMEMLLNIGKPSTALNVQSPNQAAASGASAFLPQFLSMAAGAFTGSFSAPTGVGSGINLPSMAGTAPVVRFPMMAEGGPVTGGLPNRDSVPIMAMAGEYVLPKHTTSFLGDSFLEGLRNKPEATMKTFANASAAMGKGKQVNQSTNVYVVSPDQVPAGMSKQDVIVTIADDINRNGPIKQLIKQVNNRA